MGTFLLLAPSYEGCAENSDSRPQRLTLQPAPGAGWKPPQAVMIGVGRQTINRLLRSLEQDGIATTKYASVTIHDLAAIERLSSSDGVDS